MQPLTLAANFSFFMPTLEKVKRLTAWPLTNQNYVGKLMMSHKNFGNLFSPSLNEEPVDWAVRQIVRRAF